MEGKREIAIGCFVRALACEEVDIVLTRDCDDATLSQLTGNCVGNERGFPYARHQHAHFEQAI